MFALSNKQFPVRSTITSHERDLQRSASLLTPSSCFSALLFLFYFWRLVFIIKLWFVNKTLLRMLEGFSTLLHFLLFLLNNIAKVSLTGPISLNLFKLVSRGFQNSSDFWRRSARWTLSGIVSAQKRLSDSASAIFLRSCKVSCVFMQRHAH